MGSHCFLLLLLLLFLELDLQYYGKSSSPVKVIMDSQPKQAVCGESHHIGCKLLAVVISDKIYLKLRPLPSTLEGGLCSKPHDTCFLPTPFLVCISSWTETIIKPSTRICQSGEYKGTEFAESLQHCKAKPNSKFAGAIAMQHVTSLHRGQSLLGL